MNLGKLERDLWNAADNLRANSKLTAAQYAMPVLGLIFLRHAHNRFLAVEKELAPTLPKRGGNLKPSEIDRIKKAAKDLLPKLQERRVLAAYRRERATTRAQVETAILDHFYAELPEEAFDENEVRLLSAKVFGLLMRPGDDPRFH